MPPAYRISLRRSSSMTLAAVFTVMLALSIFTLLYFMREASHDDMRDQMAAIIQTDMQSLLDAHRAGGVEEVADVLQYRLKHVVPGVMYALINRKGTVLVGNFAYLPQPDEAVGELFAVAIPDDVARIGLTRDREYRILAMRALLDEGYQLLVGRNVPETLVARRGMDRLGMVVIGLMVTLCVGGFFIGDRVVYRINLIADTAAYIIRTGDLSRRIPLPGHWDDLSKLAEMLNSLFERIEVLMEEVRHVSDNIAHDLRTPLTRLKNRLEDLHDRSQTQAPALAEDAQQLIEEADRLLHVFSAMLRISNIESGKWRAEREAVALDAVVRDVVEYYEPLAQEREQSLEVELSGAQVLGDKHLLFQAVANLVDNAVKYAPQGGRITVRLSPAPASALGCVLWVENSGSHVEEAQLEAIFRRFYRTDQAREAHKGSGLGLSLVQAVATMHQARLRAQNTNDGFGIELTFPAISMTA